MEENNDVVVEETDFNQELYEKNISENVFETEYEAGEDNENN